MKRNCLWLLLFFPLGLIAHTSFPVDIKCPLDGKKFTVRVTGSYTVFKTYMDFQKEGAIGDLYQSMIVSCSKCHFSGYVDDFDTVYSSEIKHDLLEILKPWRRKKIDDISECEIAAEIYSYFKKENRLIANLYLIASYLAKNKKGSEKRKLRQLNCAVYLERALDSGEYDKKETAYASNYYLIGELYRRLGEFEKAVKYFDIALANEYKAEWLEEAARKQRELALKKDENNDI